MLGRLTYPHPQENNRQTIDIAYPRKTEYYYNTTIHHVFMNRMTHGSRGDMTNLCKDVVA